MVTRNSETPAPLIFGEVLFDHFSDGSRVLGGAPFNVAWHLEGLGFGPEVVTAVGADETGREAIERMERWGMRTEGVQIDPQHPTGEVVATIVDGEPAFEIGIEQAYDHIDPAKAIAAAARGAVSLVYHGTLALRGDRSREALAGLRRASGAPTFVDLNLREPWWTPDLLQWCLGSATWLKLNNDELATISGARKDDHEACIEGALSLASEHDLESVIVTLGAEGALMVEEGRVAVHHAGPLGADELVDTVGAGDAFSAVACVGVLEGWDAAELLERGNAFARELCRIRGATTEDRSLYERHLEGWRAP